MGVLNGNRLKWLDAVVLATIVLVGLVKLPQPFRGDQAVFNLMASKMSRGEIIYRDLWDPKQPGIHVFYLVAGILFGFDEVGIHLFELLYMITFSIILILALKDHFRSRTVLSLIPLFTVGIYYGVSDAWHQTQIEALVGFPLFLSLWYASRSLQPASNRAVQLFISGLMGGVVLLFKFTFLPIPVAFWLTALGYLVIRRQEQLPAALLRVGLPVILGVLLPLMLVLGYFVFQNLQALVYWTFFEYPVRAVGDIPTRWRTSLGATKWFFERFAPLMALGTVGAYVSWSRRRDFLTLNLTLWFLLGFGVILFQRFGWAYYYLLLLVPLGLLGAQGLDILWPHLERLGPSATPWRNRIVAVVSLILLFLPSVNSLAAQGLLVARNGFALEKGDRLKYQADVFPDYGMIHEEVSFLAEPGTLSGDIYVFGSPLYYYFSGRDPAIPLLATWFTALPEQWVQLLEMLDEALPPYVFVGTDALDEVRNYTPKVAPYIDQTMPLIEKNYEVLRSSDAGTWYVLRNK